MSSVSSFKSPAKQTMRWTDIHDILFLREIMVGAPYILTQRVQTKEDKFG